MKKYVWYEDLDGTLHCPACRTVISCFYRGSIDEPERYEPKFCPECGQELDWTDTRPYGTDEEHA